MRAQAAELVDEDGDEVVLRACTAAGAGRDRAPSMPPHVSLVDDVHED
jgi:hypothetical protein